MFKKTILGVFLYVHSYRSNLVTALLVPVCLSIGWDVLCSDVQDTMAIIGTQFISLVIASMISLNIHRTILIESKPTSIWAGITFDKTAIWFLGHYLALTIAFLAIGGLAYFMGLAVLALMIPAVILGTRLALVFPAIALGKGVSFKYSWHLTSKYKMYIAMTVILFPLLLTIPLIVLLLLFDTPFFVKSIIGMVTTLLTTTAISIAYKLILDDLKATTSQNA
ncbi:hypothetical protein MACH09_39650 [Vibrio sp. MACH09]|uniref:hypothetical protein n=1 Tax=Vibrio sp. MACH09 TaxID=3025122 RepID=UPI002791125E|nr:hypothetical protein [Vibrio sp. MACH09]GLO63457.1 hypothetical protein MACH09_39650 [Vibrio sp. MACH09]